MNRQALDELKQQIPLLNYMQAHAWQPTRRLRGGRLMGLCPLHSDHQPSFLLDPQRNLFYCYGCARGGDVIRFAELYHQVRFPQAVARLREWSGAAPLLEQAARFYRFQLHRHSEAVRYLHGRGVRSPEVIEHLRIGYAPGACLRSWLMQLGYPIYFLRQSGLVSASDYDVFSHRIVFPWKAISTAAALVTPHHTGFCPATKAACMAGTSLGNALTSSWSKACSTSPSCGRRASTTSPVRWEAISMHVNFASCAIAPARSTWPSIPTPIKAGNVPHGRSRSASGLKESTLCVSPCRRDTIRTASSSRAATPGSSNT